MSGLESEALGHCTIPLYGVICSGSNFLVPWDTGMKGLTFILVSCARYRSRTCVFSGEPCPMDYSGLTCVSDNSTLILCSYLLQRLFRYQRFGCSSRWTQVLGEPLCSDPKINPSAGMAKAAAVLSVMFLIAVPFLCV